MARLHRVAELAAQGASIDELTASVEQELAALLDLETCRFERPAGDHALPRLERGGAVVGRSGSQAASDGTSRCPRAASSSRCSVAGQVWVAWS